jgi:large subunit ribosomal protein L25
MSELELNVELRTTGKHSSRGLRRSKQVPAVVYGPKIKNASITLKESEVVKYAKQQFDNSIFVLKSKDSQLNNVKVLKKAVTVHPVSRRPMHLDLFAIDMTKALRVFVEVRFDGKAIGAKDGGVLNTVRREVEVECLPSNIPQFLSVDVSNLGIGDSIHASELQMPADVKLITLPTETLCTVSIVEEEKAAPVAAAAPAEGAAAPAEGAAAPAAGDAAKKPEEKKK